VSSSSIEMTPRGVSISSDAWIAASSCFSSDLSMIEDEEGESI